MEQEKLRKEVLLKSDSLKFSEQDVDSLRSEND